MKAVTGNRNWMFAIIGSACLVGAAVGVAQKDTSTDVPTAATVQELSNVFRDISRRAIPAIVSIETVSKTSQIADSKAMPFGDKSPFRTCLKTIPVSRICSNNSRTSKINLDVGLPEKWEPVQGLSSISPGLVMTNSHVVNGADVVKVTLNDGRVFTASDIRMDPRSDVAVIKIDAPRSAGTAYGRQL